MFSLRSLRRQRRNVEKQLDDYLFDLQPEDIDSQLYSVNETREKFQKKLDRIDFRIEAFLALRLIKDAQALDLQVPPGSDPEMWNTIAGRSVLSPKGRSYLRKVIDDERMRRREVRAWWWKNILIPVITALTGLAGVITGMIAVIHAKK